MCPRARSPRRAGGTPGTEPPRGAARAAPRPSGGGRARPSRSRACRRRRSAPPRRAYARRASASSFVSTAARAVAALGAADVELAPPARPGCARSSVAIAACRPASSSPSFAARSAAVACSASGRRRLRTSSSTSRARSTCVATRASFSSARWRRRLKRPRPAASSTSSRRSDGFAPSTDSTLPCEITERSPPPSPTSESSSTRSIRRTAARLTRYCPSPPRCSRRATETSENGSSGQAPSSLSKRSSTSQNSTGLRVVEPAKRTSSGFSARSSCGLSEPVAQRIESEMFDLPEPFGPITTATPGLEADLDRVHERLEAAKLDRFQVHARELPRRSDAARMPAQPATARVVAPATGSSRVERLAGRVLLGVLLRGALPDAEPARRRSPRPR